MLCKVHLGECVGLCAFRGGGGGGGGRGAPGRVLGCLALLLSSCLDMGHLAEPEIYILGRLASSSGIRFLCPPVLGLCTCAGFLVFCVGVGDSNLGRAEQVLLPTKPSIPLAHFGLFIWNIDSECNSAFYFILFAYF